jgi:hypothetical protein
MKVGWVAGCLLLALPASARAQDVPPLERGRDAIETWRLNALGIVTEEVSSTGLFSSTDRWWRPVRGKFRHATKYVDFFRLVGRQDLAEQYQQRRIVGETFYWGGLAAFAGGAVLAVLDLKDFNFNTRGKVGAGLAVGGLVSMMIGGRVERIAVSEEDALQMTKAYNEKLRLELGVQPLPQEARSARPLPGLALRGRW